MVKLARILTSSHLHGRHPLLTAQVSSSSFQSSEIQTHLANVNITPYHHYVVLSSIATTASEFLSLGDSAIHAAEALFDKITSPSASLELVRSLVIFHDSVSRVLAPLDGRVEVGKFLCVGMNYRDHCTEQNVSVPTVPLIFSKFGSCIIGPEEAIPRYGPSVDGVSHGACISAIDDNEPIVTSKLDYEVELAIVIGSTVPRFTRASDAWKYIGGYTIVHDVSARDLQLEANGGQWLLGKCGDGYAPMGPVISTLDEFVTGDSLQDTLAGAGNLHIECRLTPKQTGKTIVVQSSSTSNLVFSTLEIVSYISKFTTLYAGDVIATGTPPGVGCFRKPEPLWLREGDVVECEIENIGVLKNIVVEHAHDPHYSIQQEIVDTTETPIRVDVVPCTVGSPSSATITQLGVPLQQRLANTTCVVTGGARGLGYGIALRLALEGAKVVVIIDTKVAELDHAVTQLKQEMHELVGADKNYASLSSSFYGLPCDVTKIDQVTDTFRHIVTHLSQSQRIDILVQSAGVVGQTNLLTHQLDPSNFDHVMDVNVKGIFNGCHAVLPYMLQQKYGRIINIASIAGKEGNAGMLAYSTSKAAVIGLTKTIGKEYAMSGITCNAIAPAVVRTKMVADMPEEQVKYMTDKIPMKRCGKIEEIAAMVAFVASEEAAFTTGFCWDATGGRAVY